MVGFSENMSTEQLMTSCFVQRDANYMLLKSYSSTYESLTLTVLSFILAFILTYDCVLRRCASARGRSGSWWRRWASTLRTWCLTPTS